MPNPVQAAAEGLPKDIAVAEAMRKLDMQIYDLKYMSEIACEMVLDALSKPDGHDKDDMLIFRMTRQHRDRLSFLVGNVEDRSRALLEAFNAAWKGEAVQ